MEGPPEIVDGMVMNVMTSCSLRPASRARKPPMAWMPSWELPAMRMTASLILETFGAPFGDVVANVSLMVPHVIKMCMTKRDWSEQTTARRLLHLYPKPNTQNVSNSNALFI